MYIVVWAGPYSKKKCMLYKCMKDTMIGVWWHVWCYRHQAVKILSDFKQITFFLQNTVPPSRYLYLTAETVSENGSSQFGRCSSISHYNAHSSICEAPTSSVLFDDIIPTLTGLDGNMWANQLLTLQLNRPSGSEIIFDFTGMSNYEIVERVELVMFNCPEWGIAVQNIGIWRAQSISGPRNLAGAFFSTIASCDSLVRVCTSSLDITTPVIHLQFIPATNSNRTYLAEVGFYGDSSACPQDTIITTTLPPDTTTPPPADTTTPPPPDSPPTIAISASIGGVVLLIMCLLAAVLILWRCCYVNHTTHSHPPEADTPVDQLYDHPNPSEADTPLYQLFDKKKKDGDTTHPHAPEADTPVDQLYAHPNPSGADTPVYQLYAKKKKGGDTTHPNTPVDQLYTQVDKKKKGKGKEVCEDSPQESGAVYSVVNKPQVKIF